MIKKLDEVVITICGFLLNPFITVVILLYRYAIYPNRFNNNFIITILSLFISLVNINKRIDEETDLLAYQTLFENAIGLSLNEYLFLIGKEPVFFTFQYYLAHFVNGNFLLAFFIYVFVIYFFALKSIAIFTGHLSIERQIMFPLGLVLFSFFPQTFSLAGHLLRQMIASSLMMYCLASHLVLNKKKYILALSACFIHSSLFLFLFFLLLKPYFEKKITFFQIGKIIFIACSCIIFINTAQNYLPFFIIYMIERVLNEEGTSFVVLTPIPVTGHVFMVFTLIESFLSLIHI